MSSISVRWRACSSWTARTWVVTRASERPKARTISRMLSHAGPTDLYTVSTRANHERALATQASHKQANSNNALSRGPRVATSRLVTKSSGVRTTAAKSNRG